MSLYKTNQEVLKDIEQRLLKALEQTSIHTPLDEKDLAVLVRRMFPGLSPRARRRLTDKESRTREKRFPRHVDRVDLPVASLRFIEKFRLAPTVREALGYDAPIPLERLGDELANIERFVDSKLAQSFHYPEHDYLGSEWGPETEGLHIWTIGTVFLPNPSIKWLWGNSTLKDHVDFVSDTLNCHPALALAFLLCDTPIHRDSVTVVLPPYASLYPDQNIALYVGRAEVPVWLITFMYRLAREMVLVMNSRGKPIAKSPRPRAETQRVAALVGFVNETKRLKWQQLLSRWNDRHPDWKYNNVNSMRAVYYRAKAVRTRGKGQVNSSQKNRIEKGEMSHGQN